MIDLMGQVKMVSSIDLVNDPDGGRVHIIPDINGSKAMLRVALQHIEDFPLQKNDRIVLMGNFLGDYGNTKEIIMLLRAYEAVRREQMVILRGKTEHKLLLTKKKFFESGEGLKIINHYRKHVNVSGPLANELDLSQLKSDMEWLAQKPCFFISNSYVFVHSGLAPSVALGKQDTQTCLHIQKKFHKSQRIWYKNDILGTKTALRVVHSNTAEAFDSGKPKFLLNRIDVGVTVNPGKEVSVISMGDSGVTLTKKPEIIRIWTEK